MKAFCEELNLLRNDEGIVRVPFLVRGRIVAPPRLSPSQVRAVFQSADDDTTCATLADALIVREPVIDRRSLRCTGEWVYQVMPLVQGGDLVNTDYDALSGALYPLKVVDILDYLDCISNTFRRNEQLISSVMELVKTTSEFPDSFVDGWFDAFGAFLDRNMARTMIDRELSLWGKPGSQFLDGWVGVETGLMAGPAGSMGQDAVLGRAKELNGPAEAYVRAAPTRQLHITAGNVPAVPLISTMRAILTKSAAVIKLPYGAIVTGALFAVAARTAAAEHPITRNLSMAYWRGGDDNVERALFTPGAFDRVVVWGSGETISSVRARAPQARVVAFNPRYSVSLIARGAFTGDIEQVAARACVDSLIDNQKSCSASLVHYVEGTDEQAGCYAGALQKALYRWDAAAPSPVAPSAVGQIKRLRLGKYREARWYVNEMEGRFTSGVALVPGEFDMLEHPTCRFIVVRRVDTLRHVLKYLHEGVSTVGVFPEADRLALMDSILARGISSVLPLGQCDRTFAGMPHDGAVVLSQLVDWKTA